MRPSFENESTEALADAAFAAIDDGDYARSLWIAHELKRRRFSAHFEIAGRVHYARGKIEKAKRVFARGVEVAPSVSVLWHWMGTCQSDLGEYDEAAGSFHKSLELGDLPRSMELCNLALVEQRRGRFDEALRWLDQIALEDDLGPSRVEQLELRASLHLRAGRLDLAARFVEEAQGAATPEDVDLHVRLDTLRAELAQAQGKHLRARTIANRVLHHHRSATALDVLRRARNRTSANAKLWRIMLSGRGILDDRELGFFVTYNVIADDADEAFGYARQIERWAGHRRLRLEESHVVRDEAGAAKGVVTPGGGYFFHEEDGER